MRRKYFGYHVRLTWFITDENEKMRKEIPGFSLRMYKTVNLTDTRHTGRDRTRTRARARLTLTPHHP